MKGKNKISSFVAGILLVVALFGHTPKQWLHALLADHQHVQHMPSATEAVVYATGFNCDIGQQALIHSFIVPDFVTLKETFIYGASPETPVCSITIAQPLLLHSLRGPPVA